MNIEEFLGYYYPRVAVLVETGNGKYFPFDVKDQEGIDLVMGQPLAYKQLYNIELTSKYTTTKIETFKDWMKFCHELDMDKIELLDKTKATRYYMLLGNEFLAFLNSSNPNFDPITRKVMYGF